MGYRNEATVIAAVESVMGQGEDGVEVVVVTSGGDRTADLVRRRLPQVRVVDSPTRLMPGGARNLGVDTTSGDVVAFLAADCRAEPGWVAGRLAAHRRGYPAVACSVALHGPRTPAAQAGHLLLFPARLPTRPAGEVHHPDDAAHGLSVDRSLLRALGPFDPALRVGEDTDMARRIAESGVPVWFAPEVRTSHPGPASPAALVADQFRRGRRRGATDAPQTRAPRLIARSVVDARSRLGWTLQRPLRRGEESPLRIVALSPLLAAGVVANQVGWVVGALRARTHPPEDAPTRPPPPR